MRIICLIPVLLFAMFQTSFSQGVPVVVVQKKGAATDTVLLGRTDTALRLQVKGAAAGSEYQIPLDDVSEVRFAMPASLAQAQEALNQNQWEKAATIIRPVVVPTLPYLDLPNNNGLPLAMVLADTLRRANKLEDALFFYDKLRLLPRSAESQRAALWAASCHSALNRSEQASKILQTMDAPKRDSELFAQYQIVRAQVRMAGKDYLAALDDLSQALAFSRMESELYPDAMFLTAQCYEALAATNAVSTRIVQLTLPATNRVSATAAAAAITNAPQSLTANSNYVIVAQSIYQEIVTKFPNTPAALKSQPKLPPPVATEKKKTESN
jgi:tetratricopeptide (TPR) repeat protein